MSRQEEFQKIKELIKEYFSNANCGFFDCRNMVGDLMITIFEGNYFTLDICYGYSYFELFGTTEDEFQELEEYYESLRK